MADYEYDNNIEFESEGVHITEVQQRLVDAGYYTSEITGTFDDQTKAALTSFGEAQGYSYTTDLQLVAVLQQATGPL
jgi:peptidoglycan hydrolase-like protein with peptidoglycan-binding domain